MPVIAAFDVGATMTRLVIDDRGERTYHERPTRLDSARDLLPHLISCLDSTLGSARLRRSDLSAIGIGVPGTVNDERGSVRLASNLHIGDSPLALRAGIRDIIDIPIAIENDVKTAAIGLTGRLLDPKHGVLTYLSVGTGIASGTVVDGTVLRGVHGSAGEIGQIQMERDGPTHRGSLPGTLEALAAGPVLKELSEEPITQLGRAIHTLFMLFDPELLVVGGGAAERKDVRSRIRDEVDRLRMTSPTTSSLIEMERLSFLGPHERPGIEGAAHLATQISEVSDRLPRST